MCEVKAMHAGWLSEHKQQTNKLLWTGASSLLLYFIIHVLL